MSDFLTNLAARSIGATAPLQPRLPGRFEPAADASNGDLPKIDSEAGSPFAADRPHAEAIGARHQALDEAPAISSGTPAAGHMSSGMPASRGYSAASDIAAPRFQARRDGRRSNIPASAPQHLSAASTPAGMPAAQIDRAAPAHVATSTPASASALREDAVPAANPPTSAPASVAPATPGVGRALAPALRPMTEPSIAATRPDPAHPEAAPLERATARHKPAQPRSGPAAPDRFDAAAAGLPSIQPNLPAWLPEQLTPPPANPVAPTIHVTIGRVEVRASARPARPARPAARPTVQTLEEYLRSRGGTS